VFEYVRYSNALVFGVKLRKVVDLKEEKG